MRFARLSVAFAAAAATLALAANPVAEPPPAPAPQPYGWTPLGQVALEKNACASCPATFPTANRFVSFGLASDSPFPISLAGRFDVRCIDGSNYHFFLSSPMRGGVFQIVDNVCVNYESASVTLSMTTVALSPPDLNRAVVLTVYGINHSNSTSSFTRTMVAGDPVASE